MRRTHHRGGTWLIPSWFVATKATAKPQLIPGSFAASEAITPRKYRHCDARPRSQPSSCVSVPTHCKRLGSSTVTSNLRLFAAFLEIKLGAQFPLVYHCFPSLNGYVGGIPLENLSKESQRIAGKQMLRHVTIVTSLLSHNSWPLAAKAFLQLSIDEFTSPK